MNDLFSEGTILTGDLPFEGLCGSPMAPPIYQTSLFTFPDVSSLRDAISDELKSNLYTRGNNPTVQEVERKVARLEKAEKAKLLSSGVSAIAAAMIGSVKAGDHIVCTADSYGWARYICGTYLKRFGVEADLVDGEDLEALKGAVRENTRLIYLESPGSMTLRIKDLEAIAGFARARGIKTAIDNTWATPLYQNPLDFGIDLVLHSASKYLGGHSDVIGGIIAGSEEEIDHIFRTEFLPIGTVPDPFQAWLILRGLRTLRVRLAEHYKNALAAADFLSSHPAVERVNYPMHPSHPQYDLARSQMSGGCGLLSLRLKEGTPEGATRFVESLRCFHLGVSWGGYESLVFPAAVTDGGDPSLVRMHFGLEESDVLLKDLEQALEPAASTSI
jgi:cystathionine beta-lyase/cystathionine gamma-synthase